MDSVIVTSTPMPVWAWLAFGAIIIVLLVLDMKVFHRKSSVITIKQSLLWTAFWISLALLFNLGLWLWRRDTGMALDYLTCYLIEKSLSVDNLFVFLMVFSFFSVPTAYQHKVLFWGIIGAIVLRLAFIEAGATLLENFGWVFYIFGAFLIIAALRMAFQKEKELHPEKNPILKLLRKFVGVSDCYEGDRFFIKRAGKYIATPLLIVVIIIETTDVVFALDSIPAAFSITTDKFIVYTSNIFAILGLRSLYFALAGIMPLFHYLKYGLVAVLMFVGVKMIVEHHYHYEMPTAIALGVVLVVLVIAVVASIIRNRRNKAIQR
ncbi:MAG: TerC family protein [Dehalococcoidia bacterium]